jgi:GDPmannose 4,6-dehydratase
MTIALIAGISGQDGSYLAEFLLGKGYTVIGTSRDSQTHSFANLQKLGILDQVELRSMSMADFRSVLSVLADAKPDEIYNLSGQTSVGLSYSQPVETLDSIATSMLNLLEVIRFLDVPARIYNAGSSECFGNLPAQKATEDTPFKPRSPYAVAKAAAHWEVSTYRESYDIFACTGILFNHESPLRSNRFVTKKITNSARLIADGTLDKLRLGNIEIERDWGWAPDYVQAMWKMLQQDAAEDYVIATGERRSLGNFLESAFAYFDLDWRDHVETEKGLFRPADIATSCGNPAKAKAQLNWESRYVMEDVVRLMLEADASH